MLRIWPRRRGPAQAIGIAIRVKRDRRTGEPKASESGVTRLRVFSCAEKFRRRFLQPP